MDIWEVERIINEKTKNTLFEIFAQDYNNAFREKQLTLIPETPNKRSLSPGDQHTAGPARKQMKRKLGTADTTSTFSSPILRTRRMTLGVGDGIKESLRKKDTIGTRKRTYFVGGKFPGHGQRKIKDTLKSQASTGTRELHPLTKK